MKFNKHQKEIVKKIIDGEVFDIQSYLRVFNKSHVEKYDMEALKSAFVKSEEGKFYKVIKDGYSLFTSGSVHTIMGTSYSFPQMRMNIPEEEYELKSAVFIEELPPIKYTYNEKEYEYDFSEGVSVITNFDEVLDFLTLWYYLKQEGLVLEVNEPLRNADIGLFFKKINLKTPPQKPEIKIEYEGKPLTPIHTCDVESKQPERFAYEYCTETWIIDEDNLLICKDYLGKKIVRTSALVSFATKNFKTREQVAQDNNFRVALIALVISVLSIIMSNIVPLFQKQSTDYLNDISQQLSIIENQLSEIEDALVANSNKTETDIENILSDLERIEEAINDYKNEKMHSDLEAILKELSEIKQLLTEGEK